MTQSRPFDDILDECLERLFSADGTVEQCLEAYPEHAAELAPLLRTAVAARRAVSVEPNADFKARAKCQVLAEADRTPRRFTWPRLSLQPRWAMVGLVVLAIVVAGGGTVVAADTSMPGSALYGVKLVTERVRLAMTFSDVGKAELLAKMADRRVAEIDDAVAKGRSKHVAKVTERLMEHLERMSGLSLAKETPALVTPEKTPDATIGEVAPSAASAVSGNGRSRLKRVGEAHRQRHPAKLREALGRAPESVRALLRKAITASEDSYDRVLEELKPTRSKDGSGKRSDEAEPAKPRQR